MGHNNIFCRKRGRREVELVKQERGWSMTNSCHIGSDLDSNDLF